MTIPRCDMCGDRCDRQRPDSDVHAYECSDCGATLCADCKEMDLAGNDHCDECPPSPDLCRGCEIAREHPNERCGIHG